MSVGNLEHLFRPRAVALIGADKGSASPGRVVAQNLFSGDFDGPVMPVHASDVAVQGVLAYASVAALPVPPDLAVIASPTEGVPDLVAEAGAHGARAAVVISPGLDGCAPDVAAALRARMLEAARPYRLRILGPASLGVLVPGIGLNASWAHIPAAAGDLAFISQSASLMSLMLDWAAARGVGFSVVASLGDMTDVDFGDLLDFLALDAETRAVLLCVDHIANARKFLSAARAAARLKPVIVFDAARLDATIEAATDAASRAGRSAVNDAAFRRAGMLPVPSLEDLAAAAGTLGTGIRITGDRLAVVSNGRGIGRVAGDLVLREGGRLADLSAETQATLDRLLPKASRRRNPIDLLADADGARWRAVLAALDADPEVDAVVAISAPSAAAESLPVARAVAERPPRGRKPLAAVWMENCSLNAAQNLLGQSRVPVHQAPGPAIEALMQLVRWRRNQDMLMQTPASLPELFERDLEAARAVVTRALGGGSETLSEPEAKRVLAAYGIPVAAAEDAATPDEAGEVARRIGFPVSLRIRGVAAITLVAAGRSDIALGLESAADVVAAARRLERTRREALPTDAFPGFTVRAQIPTDHRHELRAGVALDRVFGPVVLFGQGGDVAQVLRDQSIGLPPLNLGLARLLIEETPVHRLLAGYGDRPAADLDDVALALVKLAQLAAELPEVVEVDVNPLLAGADGVVAVRARIRVRPAAGPGEARLAIRPYPIELEKAVRARDGTSLTMRPIRPEDAPALQAFVRDQSPEDRRLRFFSHVKELDHRTTARLTQIDYDREMAFVLVDPRRDADGILGVMRISADAAGARAEYAGMVSSTLKGQGLGRMLLEEIIDYARRRGIGVVWGEVLAENRAMLALVRKLGFDIDVDGDDPSLMLVEKRLQ